LARNSPLGEILLALIFFASLANQAMLALNAMDGHVREGQIEFALHAR